MIQLVDSIYLDKRIAIFFDENILNIRTAILLKNIHCLNFLQNFYKLIFILKV